VVPPSRRLVVRAGLDNARRIREANDRSFVAQEEEQDLGESGEKAVSRREEILEVARDLFARHGYAATSMRDIAEADGIKASSLYSHFRSKAEILLLVVSPVTDEIAQAQETALAARGSGLERLRKMVAAVLRVCVDHDRAVSILHYSWPQIRTSDDLAALVATNAEIFLRWQQVIADGVADGSLRADIDVIVAARLVTSALQGIADRERYVDTVGLAARRGFDALLADFDAVVLVGLGAEREVLART
jgi:TetR/AcrR family transcriptional regulator, cholesterol catabolism regulator